MIATLGEAVRDWAPVASAALAATAAAASWMSVRQNRRQWLLAQSPVLVSQLVDNVAKTQMELHVHNAGPGAARRVQFCLALETEYVTGYAGPYFGALLDSDETREIITQLASRTGEVACVVTCLDAAGRRHSFDALGHHVVRRDSDAADHASDPLAAFARHYPDRDLSAMTKVGGSARPKSDGR